MTAQRRSLGPAHFRRLYDANADPWQFRTSAYEQEKYRRSIAALENRSFSSAFEVGCSIGLLSRLLAPCCQAVLAVDIIEQPLAGARAACADLPWVRFERMRVPREWPNATFDLIVLSEVLYFLSPADIASVVDRIAGSLVPNGVVLLVNWCGRSDDPCTGEQAARVFMQRTRDWLQPQTHHYGGGQAVGHDRMYRLDLLVRH
jgi:2-polyprenyl-3-methyl-5-hydroxy-6-metoxy-1,4-benzoquinol methylase